MRRREVLLNLAAAAAVEWPLMARAQQKQVLVIGYLNSNSPERTAPLVVAFRAGLKEACYVEGENVAIEFRWAEGQYDRRRWPPISLPARST